jgi:glycosyltransferase involved in cell wall biosynthesis
LRLLLITYAFPPLVTPRSIQLARLVKYLTREGVHVHVVAANPRHTAEAEDPQLAEIYRFEEGFFRATRTPALENRYVTSGLGLIHPGFRWLPDPKVGWYPFAIRAASRLLAEERFDAVMSCAMPHTSSLVGLRLKRRFGLTWVAHLSDPWSLNPYMEFLGPGHKRLAAGWESSVFREADGVAFVSKTTLDAYQKLYPGLEEKSALLPHCFDPEESPEHEISRGEVLRIVHVGNFYGRRSPGTFLEALAGMDRGTRDRVRFIFAGKVGRKDMDAARSLGLSDTVEFLGPVPYHRAATLANLADAYLLIDGPGRGSHFFPSKLVDYLAGARPIIGITPEAGEAAAILGSFGQPVCAPRDPEAIRGLLEKAVGGEIEPPDAEEVLARYSAGRAAGRTKEALSRAMDATTKSHGRDV